MICQGDYYIAIAETIRYGVFTPEVPALVYYSHVTAIVSTLLLSIFVFAYNRSLPAKILLAISFVFSTLAVLDIFLWILPDAGIIMFLWSFWLSLFILIFGLSFYFLYVFITKNDLRFIYKLLFLLTVFLIEVFSVSTLNLEYLDYDYCEAVEGVWMLNSVFGYSFIIMIFTAAFGIFKIRQLTDPVARSQATLATIGITAFLFIFAVSTYLTSLFSIFIGDGDYVFETEQYGYYGMTIFMGFLAYTIVQYKAFNIKLIGANALVVVLTLLIAAQYIFTTSKSGLVLTSSTLLLTLIFGYYLIKSVRKEVKQREEIEQLAKKLEKANKRLKILDQMKSEFVSIASHQLRSPLTSIRGYSSMLLEGSYGKLTEKARDAIERIGESSRMMALSVEDYLNVSRIQAGNMKYEYADFNLADTASHIADDVRREALKKGLVLSFKSDMNKQGVVHADKGKTMQILHNLINNALKYTPKGTITVFAHDKGKKIMIDVIDTGIGMSEETIESVFGKFERAKNANEVNVTGTGLGLYVAQKMAQEMGGDIEAFSDGEEKGSTFRLTLPLQL